MKKILLVFMIIPFLGLSTTGRVKNVILLIGDGMGLAQLSTAFYYNGTEKPNFNRFPIVGLINTSSAKEKVTDSAAGATAFATGKKSYNGAISVDTNNRAIPTLIEIIRTRGIHSGLIATSSITHATPACFYSHVNSRSEQEKIAQFLPKSMVDFFAGGGLKYFNKRSDKLDVINSLIENGYIIDTTTMNLAEKLDTINKYGYFLGDGGLPSKLEGRNDFLVNATNHAINYLNQFSNGFFLMVEGSQIDWEGHAANSIGIIEEVKDFDKAVGAALDFAEQDGHTLVIVTADHETGGFALTPSKGDEGTNYAEISPSFYEGAINERSASHTATLIPVLAYGPGARMFSGFYDNTDVFHKIMQVTQWKSMPFDKNKIKESLKPQRGGNQELKVYPVK